MTEWMNQLEQDLGALQPIPPSHDLTTAALVASRDREVLRAVRLRGDLSDDQLESVLSTVSQTHPDLIADSDSESGTAIALVRTPQAAAVSVSRRLMLPAGRAGLCVRGVVAIALLAACFVSGMVAGDRTAGDDSRLAVRPEKNKPTGSHGSAFVARTEDPTKGSNSGQRPFIEPVQSVGPRFFRNASPGRSSLSDMAAAYHRRRLNAARAQASL